VQNRVRYRFRSVRGVVVNFLVPTRVYARGSFCPVGAFVRSHQYICLSFLLPLSFCCSFSHRALRVPFPVSKARNTSNLLAAQIEIEQSAVKRKWGYWPVPLRPVIDFHFAATLHLTTSRASRTLLFLFAILSFSIRSSILWSTFYRVTFNCFGIFLWP